MRRRSGLIAPRDRTVQPIMAGLSGRADERTVAMKPVSLMAISIALLSLSVAGEPVYAQQSDRQKITVTINTDLVVTWAQVMDRKDGKFVSGLEIGDFALREE